jgi:hypothetical protein
MFEPSRARDTIRSSTETGYPAPFKRLESVIGTWQDLAVCDMHVVTRSMLVGEMPVSAALLITCKRGNFRRLWINSSNWPKNGEPQSCVRKLCLWRCHRSLIGDALLVRGCGVEEILSATRSRAHTITPWAMMRGKQLFYPAHPEKIETVV